MTGKPDARASDWTHAASAWVQDLWTVDPAVVLAYARQAPWLGPQDVQPLPDGFQLLDAAGGLVTHAYPHRRTGNWLACTWIVNHGGVPDGHASIDAGLFALAAAVAVAARPNDPDATMLLSHLAGGSWIPPGIHPGAIVLRRLVNATRQACRNPGGQLGTVT